MQTGRKLRAPRHGTTGMVARLIRLFHDPSAYEELPARVKEAIRAQQDHSEIIIGWIQLAVVIAFGVLYTLSPKTFSAETMIAPVPWALSAYLGFTLLRLGLAYRVRLPGWFLGVSVVIDVGLLMALIWSFHIQYQQPPSFVLKAPTLLYAFIVIALRALRFEARFVLLAGAVAAAGWLALVLYVVSADATITRDYVAYMTSNSILLGAEFDKIVSILVVTAILALALVRARQLLIGSIAGGTAARELSRFFAPEIARQITGAEDAITAGHGELREAAILQVDLRGFTALAQAIAPDAVMALLADYQARMVPVIRRHGGSVDKFLGDGILATFGAAVPEPRHAAAALSAADAVMAEAEAWNRDRANAGDAPIVVKLGLATGRVVFGAVGDEDRLEYTVIGEAVNLAAKLEKHTAAEGVRALATLAALREAEAQGYRPVRTPERRPARQVPGVEGPLDLVVLAA